MKNITKNDIKEIARLNKQDTKYGFDAQRERKLEILVSHVQEEMERMKKVDDTVAEEILNELLVAII